MNLLPWKNIDAYKLPVLIQKLYFVLSVLLIFTTKY